MTNTEAIKQRITCVDYARSQGINITSGKRTVSPLRPGAKNPTSFVIYDDFWYDFGDGHGGDVIDFAAELLYNGDKGKAIRELARLTGVEDEQKTNWKDYTQRLCSQIQSWHEHLTEEDREYIRSRGITDETIDRLKLGRTENGRLSIPYWKNGYVCYYITRHLNGGAYPESKYRKAKIDGMNENIVWGLHTLSRDSDTLIIAEGAFDIMSFEQEGYCCLSAITGHFSAAQLPSVIAASRNFKRVLIVYDNDYVTHAGEKFSIKMAKILSRNRIPFVVGTVPKYKDVSEYYAAGGNLQSIIDNAVEGTRFLGKIISDPDELEAYCKDVCRFMSRPTVERFFKDITSSSNLDRDFLATLLKECKSAPADKYIAQKIVAEHQLLYNEKISFFEYNSRYWEARSDTFIRSIIDRELGAYSTGSRISSILTIVKSLVSTDELFNQKQIMNFLNGTLDLTGGEIVFREHRDSDRCTYCLNYPYDPEARCDEWDQFLNDVTDYDDMKINTLQEFAGYTLFADNRFCRCPVLLGEGANGKSVFLNVLTAVFGAENTTNIEMSDLAQPFQAILLMTSMLNISGETSTNVNGAETKFKQIVAGDEISACYKGKDFISFRPRCKMFIACNNYMRFSDDSDGFSRRLHFITFPIKFCENPKKQNEKQVDYGIAERLTTASSLSGIFNWVLSGYRQLKAVNYFTEASDHQTSLEELKETSNPLIIFIKEYEFRDDFTTNESLYEDYKDWCEKCLHKPRSMSSFVRAAAKAISEYHDDVTPGRTYYARGYKKI